VTTTLVGLSQLRFRWDLLGPATREAIVAAVDGAAPGLNDREVRLAASPPLRPACPASVSVHVIPPNLCPLVRAGVQPAARIQQAGRAVDGVHPARARRPARQRRARPGTLTYLTWQEAPCHSYFTPLPHIFVVSQDKLVSQQGSMAVYSLGLMGVVMADGAPAVQDTLYTVAMSVLNESLTANGSRVAMQQVPHAPPTTATRHLTPHPWSPLLSRRPT
jgi:hypothetical protein